MIFGERIVLAIVEEEIRRVGCVVSEGLSDRLLSYLDEPERERLLADASTLMAVPVVHLTDAFLYLLPIDRPVLAVERGIRLKPMMKDIVLLS